MLGQIWKTKGHASNRGMIMIMKSLSWKQLKTGILNDELPKDRSKYVRYSNLASINKKMVIYYLRSGFKNPENRSKYLRGILDEMLRSSNERYDIEDASKR
tara:strand:+ start:128 stop:430 length:303 start_codon:yes stop_codon:yes gene_type:complete